MNIKTVKFVSLRDLKPPSLFRGHLADLGNCSWGDNAYSLVSKSFLSEAIKQIRDEIEIGANLNLRYTAMEIRLAEVPDDAYIDLEA